MFTTKQQLHPIINPKIYKNFIFGFTHYSRKEIIKYNFIKNEKVIHHNSKIKEFYSFSSYFLADFSDKVCFINENSEPYNCLPSAYKMGINYNYSNFLLIYKGRYDNREFGIFSIRENKIIWKKHNIKGLEKINNLLLNRQNSYLTKYDIRTGTQLWQFDITGIDPGGKISRLIGVYQNILIAGIGTDWLIGIHTETGELVWKEKAIPNFDVIDYNKGILHSITSGYVKTDPLTGKTLDLFDDKNYFEKVIGIESQRDNYAIVGKHLITTDWRKGKIGAFNTLTHRFDWIYEEKGISFPAGHPVQYAEPYLFVMDNKHNLHIFEKEKTIRI